MTETTVLLTLPIRRVVLGAATTPPPDWLQAQHRRVAQRMSARSPKSSGSRTANSAAETPSNTRLREQIETLEMACGQLQHAVKTMQIHWQQIILPEVQRTAIELAHAIAAKLVLDRVHSDQFPIENLVREVVERLNTDQSIVVKLHPADLVVWQKHVESHVSATTLGDHVRVQADKNLARGDCQAASGEVSIVYELQRQIDELRVLLVS
ncbi:MAG: FliH/SctL family protein [Planctomycetia bacterium]|nr:FliH/SctL family protein [Planctomycetia bacterium]